MYEDEEVTSRYEKFSKQKGIRAQIQYQNFRNFLFQNRSGDIRPFTNESSVGEHGSFQTPGIRIQQQRDPRYSYSKMP